MGVVEGALAQLAFLIQELPRRARVVGPEYAPGGRFYDCEDTIRVDGRDGHTDLADYALWQPGIPRDLGPRLARVGGLEESTPRSSARHRPWRAIGLPQCRKEHMRVARVYRNVNGGCPVIAVEGFLPVHTAID